MASAFAFEHQRLNMEDLRSMIRSELVSFSEQPEGRQALANNALKTVRRLLNTKRPWVGTLPDTHGRRRNSFSAQSSISTSLRALSSNWKSLDARGMTVTLLRRVFGCNEMWEPESEVGRLGAWRGGGIRL
ncbi:MAG: hypothetical protein SGPRY_002887 [Prymnesium sp.]